MTLKSNVFNEFQKSKSLVEKDSGCHITTLTSNNGGELYSKQFNNFWAKHGIKIHFTTPYTPKKNGMVES